MHIKIVLLYLMIQITYKIGKILDIRRMYIVKIIHTADIHLGSKMDSRFSEEIANERKAELRNTFRRLVEYAKDNDVTVIMLCGDVFDSDRPFKKESDYRRNIGKKVEIKLYAPYKGEKFFDAVLLEYNPVAGNVTIDKGGEVFKLNLTQIVKMSQ